MNPSNSADRFYFISIVTMAVLCLGGFVPTFFLRSSYFEDPLPPLLVIHGVLLTSWYLVAIAQSWLILKRKYGFHRQLGIAAAVIAVSAFIMTYLAVAFLQATGGYITGGPAMNISLTTAFFCGVACGLYYRGRPAVHKRLMLLSTAALTIPGFDRLMTRSLNTLMPTLELKGSQLIVLAIFFLFVGLLVYKDFREFRHPALGTGLSFVCFAIGGTAGWFFVGTAPWNFIVEMFA